MKKYGKKKKREKEKKSEDWKVLANEQTHVCLSYYNYIKLRAFRTV